MDTTPFEVAIGSKRELKDAKVEIFLTLANGSKFALATVLNGDEADDAKQLRYLGIALQQGALWGNRLIIPRLVGRHVVDELGLVLAAPVTPASQTILTPDPGVVLPGARPLDAATAFIGLDLQSRFLHQH